jgi:hypothetical protein
MNNINAVWDVARFRFMQNSLLICSNDGYMYDKDHEPKPPPRQLTSNLENNLNLNLKLNDNYYKKITSTKTKLKSNSSPTGPPITSVTGNAYGYGGYDIDEKGQQMILEMKARENGRMITKEEEDEKHRKLAAIINGTPEKLQPLKLIDKKLNHYSYMSEYEDTTTATATATQTQNQTRTEAAEAEVDNITALSDPTLTVDLNLQEVCSDENTATNDITNAISAVYASIDDSIQNFSLGEKQIPQYIIEEGDDDDDGGAYHYEHENSEGTNMSVITGTDVPTDVATDADAEAAAMVDLDLASASVSAAITTTGTSTSFQKNMNKLESSLPSPLPLPLPLPAPSKDPNEETVSLSLDGFESINTNIRLNKKQLILLSPAIYARSPNNNNDNVNINGNGKKHRTPLLYTIRQSTTNNNINNEYIKTAATMAFLRSNVWDTNRMLLWCSRGIELALSETKPTDEKTSRSTQLGTKQVLNDRKALISRLEALQLGLYEHSIRKARNIQFTDKIMNMSLPMSQDRINANTIASTRKLIANESVKHTRYGPYNNVVDINNITESKPIVYLSPRSRAKSPPYNSNKSMIDAGNKETSNNYINSFISFHEKMKSKPKERCGSPSPTGSPITTVGSPKYKEVKIDLFGVEPGTLRLQPGTPGTAVDEKKAEFNDSLITDIMSMSMSKSPRTATTPESPRSHSTQISPRIKIGTSTANVTANANANATTTTTTKAQNDIAFRNPLFAINDKKYEINKTFNEKKIEIENQIQIDKVIKININKKLSINNRNNNKINNKIISIHARKTQEVDINLHKMLEKEKFLVNINNEKMKRKEKKDRASNNGLASLNGIGIKKITATTSDGNGNDNGPLMRGNVAEAYGYSDDVGVQMEHLQHFFGMNNTTPTTDTATGTITGRVVASGVNAVNSARIMQDYRRASSALGHSRPTSTTGAGTGTGASAGAPNATSALSGNNYQNIKRNMNMMKEEGDFNLNSGENSVYSILPYPDSQPNNVSVGAYDTKNIHIDAVAGFNDSLTAGDLGYGSLTFGDEGVPGSIVSMTSGGKVPTSTTTGDMRIYGHTGMGPLDSTSLLSANAAFSGAGVVAVAGATDTSKELTNLIANSTQIFPGSIVRTNNSQYISAASADNNIISAGVGVGVDASVAVGNSRSIASLLSDKSLTAVPYTATATATDGGVGADVVSGSVLNMESSQSNFDDNGDLFSVTVTEDVSGNGNGDGDDLIKSSTNPQKPTSQPWDLYLGRSGSRGAVSGIKGTSSRPASANANANANENLNGAGAIGTNRPLSSSNTNRNRPKSRGITRTAAAAAPPPSAGVGKKIARNTYGTQSREILTVPSSGYLPPPALSFIKSDTNKNDAALDIGLIIAPVVQELHPSHGHGQPNISINTNTNTNTNKNKNKSNNFHSHLQSPTVSVLAPPEININKDHIHESSRPPPVWMKSTQQQQTMNETMKSEMFLPEIPNSKTRR